MLTCKNFERAQPLCLKSIRVYTVQALDLEDVCCGYVVNNRQHVLGWNHKHNRFLSFRAIIWSKKCETSRWKSRGGTWPVEYSKGRSQRRKQFNQESVYVQRSIFV